MTKTAPDLSGLVRSPAPAAGRPARFVARTSAQSAQVRVLPRSAWGVAWVDTLPTAADSDTDSGHSCRTVPATSARGHPPSGIGLAELPTKSESAPHADHSHARAAHQTCMSSPSDVCEQSIRRSAGVLGPFSTRTVGVQDSFPKSLFNHAICLKMFCKSIGTQVFRRLSTYEC